MTAAATRERGRTVQEPSVKEARSSNPRPVASVTGGISGPALADGAGLSTSAADPSSLESAGGTGLPAVHARA
jgi:hypothetical protein